MKCGSCTIAAGAAVGSGSGVGDDSCTSTAPMSHLPPGVSGRTNPRWSETIVLSANESPPLQLPFGMASMTGLPVSGSSVGVGPPLSDNVASFGTLLGETLSVGLSNPQVSSSEKL